MKTDIYTLAHEIKNPLCVVKGYLKMLDNENMLKYKRIINEEINTSLEILNNYLEYNRLILKKENIDLNVFLLEIKTSMKDYLKDKHVHLNIDLMDDEIYLDADYAKLKQVFYNIIKNSYEASSHHINISYQVLFNRVNLTISNDGKPIDDISKIGNHFSNKILGNGIGTNISKKIIELHNGKMKYRNNKNRGISIYITLPLS